MFRTKTWHPEIWLVPISLILSGLTFYGYYTGNSVVIHGFPNVVMRPLVSFLFFFSGIICFFSCFKIKEIVERVLPPSGFILLYLCMGTWVWHLTGFTDGFGSFMDDEFLFKYIRIPREPSVFSTFNFTLIGVYAISFIYPFHKPTIVIPCIIISISIVNLVLYGIYALNFDIGVPISLSSSISFLTHGYILFKMSKKYSNPHLCTKYEK